MYNCSECIERLYPFLDRELDTQEQLQVREHLSLCRDCLNRFRFEGNVLRAIGKVARSTGCPDDARQRLMQAIERGSAT